MNYIFAQLKKGIGVFDSGLGGLTVLRELIHTLPEYDYIYLGDNARTPYGNRSFETVYAYTLQAVEWFFNQGCELVILACNTASAKALRTIQQRDLPAKWPGRRVLGVIRPTAEIIGNFTYTGSIGILATAGTVNSESYLVEIEKFFPTATVYQQACPLWVPLIENAEHLDEGADYFVKKYLGELKTDERNIDTVLLACTHYPLLEQKIKENLRPHVKVLAQGDIVAASLKDYLQRHPEIEEKLAKNKKHTFFTTDSVSEFDRKAEALFFGKAVKSEQVIID